MLSEVIYLFKDADVITSLCLMKPWDTGIKTHSSHRDSFPLVAERKKKNTEYTLQTVQWYNKTNSYQPDKILHNK